MKKLKKCSWKKGPKCGSEEILYSERERKKNGSHEWGDSAMMRLAVVRVLKQPMADTHFMDFKHPIPILDRV